MSNQVRLAAVGDVFVNRKNPDSAFAKVKRVFDASDVVFGNLEAPVTDRGSEAKLGPQFGKPRIQVLVRSPEATTPALKRAGFDVMSLANTHMLDFGEAGMLDTVASLRKRGIAHAGAGKNEAEAVKPAVVSKNGIKLAFLSFDSTVNKYLGKARADRAGIARVQISPFFPPPYTDSEDLDDMKAIIRKVKKKADFVIAAIHWGESPSSTLTTIQRALGHEIVDAGADLILGHHSHQIQPIEVYKHAVICYGLGTFVFEFDQSEWKNETMIFECLFKGSRISEASFYVGQYLNPNRQPTLVKPSSAAGKAMFQKMKKLSAPLGTRLSVDGEKIKVALR